MSEQWILWGREQVRGSVTVGLQAEKPESVVEGGGWGPLNRGHSLQVRQLERFQILSSAALNTQDEEELNKFSSAGVCQTPRRPWGREHKKTKICAWEDHELLGEEEAYAREKRDDHELLKWLSLALVDGL